ncbi:MAG: 30S ribosomal protein S2 [Candidatus Gracilibacteria bacterium]|nr:30S ribosomal protein S2 [Candidatus Gracilibacteria bacterium]
MEKTTLNSMFENLLHIGNKANYWNPRMKSYIYGSVNGIHVINLTKTVEKIEEVKAELKELHTSGKKILFVGTKLQARDAIAKMASESGHFYVTEKWVPGLLTNFKTIKKRIATYMQLDKDLNSGAFDMLTKKEKASKMLELDKLTRAFAGVKDMKKIPDVVFVIDGVFEAQAIREANQLKLLSYAVLNTNGDDTFLTNCIPANTNSVKSIDYITEALRESLSGKAKVVSAEGTEAPVKKVRKVSETKVSGEKKAPAKRAPKKAEGTEAETSTEA